MIAVLLLPLLGLLLFLMDRVEDRVMTPPKTSRHAGRRHLRLVRNPDRPVGERRPARHRSVRGGSAPVGGSGSGTGTGRADAA
ncbi:hypothetical protein ADL06_18725 [Streptomyces sp. NRRL F-6491]|nr:hypothetical protein ADL06_18725 [Streptomyces sp. NRRL F-6491]KOX41452.1 hypothetical protein ADL08_18970 [Streptomyces sp. NRRL F-6492]